MALREDIEICKLTEDDMTNMKKAAVNIADQTPAKVRPVPKKCKNVQSRPPFIVPREMTPAVSVTKRVVQVSAPGQPSKEVVVYIPNTLTSQRNSLHSNISNIPVNASIQVVEINNDNEKSITNKSVSVQTPSSAPLYPQSNFDQNSQIAMNLQERSMRVVDCLLNVGHMAAQSSVEIGRTMKTNIDTNLPDGRDLLDLNNTDDLSAFIDEGKTLDGFNITEIIDDDSGVASQGSRQLMGPPRLQITDGQQNGTVPSTIPSDVHVNATNTATPQKCDVAKQSLETDFTSKCALQLKGQSSKSTNSSTHIAHSSGIRQGSKDGISSISHNRADFTNGSPQMINVCLSEQDQAYDLRKPPKAHCNNQPQAMDDDIPEALDLTVCVKPSASPVFQIDGQNDSKDDNEEKKGDTASCPLVQANNESNNEQSAINTTIEILSSSEDSNSEDSCVKNISPGQPLTKHVQTSSGTSTQGSSDDNRFRHAVLQLQEQKMSAYMNTNANSDSNSTGVESAEQSVKDESDEPVEDSQTPSSVICDVNRSTDSFHEYQPEGWRFICTETSEDDLVSSGSNNAGLLNDLFFHCDNHQ